LHVFWGGLLSNEPLEVDMLRLKIVHGQRAIKANFREVYLCAGSRLQDDIWAGSHSKGFLRPKTNSTKTESQTGHEDSANKRQYDNTGMRLLGTFNVTCCHRTLCRFMEYEETEARSVADRNKPKPYQICSKRRQQVSHNGSPMATETFHWGFGVSSNRQNVLEL